MLYSGYRQHHINHYDSYCMQSNTQMQVTFLSVTIHNSVFWSFDCTLKAARAGREDTTSLPVKQNLIETNRTTVNLDYVALRDESSKLRFKGPVEHSERSFTRKVYNAHLPIRARMHALCHPPTSSHVPRTPTSTPIKARTTSLVSSHRNLDTCLSTLGNVPIEHLSRIRI